MIRNRPFSWLWFKFWSWMYFSFDTKFHYFCLDMQVRAFRYYYRLERKEKKEEKKRFRENVKYGIQ